MIELIHKTIVQTQWLMGRVGPRLPNKAYIV